MPWSRWSCPTILQIRSTNKRYLNAIMLVVPIIIQIGARSPGLAVILRKSMRYRYFVVVVDINVDVFIDISALPERLCPLLWPNGCCNKLLWSSIWSGKAPCVLICTVYILRWLWLPIAYGFKRFPLLLLIAIRRSTSSYFQEGLLAIANSCFLVLFWRKSSKISPIHNGDMPLPHLILT